MPKLELTQFHGEMEYWITFKELFQATVIDNADLTEIDKLQYLFASVKGINGVNAETSLHSCTIEFTPHFSSPKLNLEAIVVNKVTSPLPNFQFENRQFPRLKNLKLADPNFCISNLIDVSLGAEIYANLLEGLPILGPTGTPAAIPTINWDISSLEKFMLLLFKKNP
ncbi:hypothetical protein TNCV_3182021 [Trichonephila clavipes]|nr:hypothetical protein TNCV_3182021 [Trichonephila clavipes]